MSNSNIVPTNQPSVYTKLDTLSTLKKNAIVRPNNPPPGVAGFVFDIVVEDNVELAADVTDHYVEDNTAVQDHVALKPEQVTVRGLVGEIALTQDQQDQVADQVDALPLNEELLPPYTDVQLQEYAEEALQAQAEEAALTGDQSLLGVFDSSVPLPATKQSRAFAYFYQLWRGRELFTVDTPWGFFTDMVILSLRATQGEETKYISDFTIVFKKIRKAQELQVSPGQIAGRAEQQLSPASNNGVLGAEDPTPKQSESILHNLLNG